jgi:hypothetical protein
VKFKIYAFYSIFMALTYYWCNSDQNIGILSSSPCREEEKKTWNMDMYWKNTCEPLHATLMVIQQKYHLSEKI